MKSNSKVCAFGQVDELNVSVGSCLVLLKKINNKELNKLCKLLIKIQNQLFNLGNMLAVDENFVNDSMPIVSKESIVELENKINYYNQSLSELNSFKC